MLQLMLTNPCPIWLSRSCNAKLTRTCTHNQQLVRASLCHQADDRWSCYSAWCPSGCPDQAQVSSNVYWWTGREAGQYMLKQRVYYHHSQIEKPDKPWRLQMSNTGPDQASQSDSAGWIPQTTVRHWSGMISHWSFWCFFADEAAIQNSIKEDRLTRKLLKDILVSGPRHVTKGLQD